jgi:hypothetical protein
MKKQIKYANNDKKSTTAVVRNRKTIYNNCRECPYRQFLIDMLDHSIQIIKALPREKRKAK